MFCFVLLPSRKFYPSHFYHFYVTFDFSDLIWKPSVTLTFEKHKRNENAFGDIIRKHNEHTGSKYITLTLTPQIHDKN